MKHLMKSALALLLALSLSVGLCLNGLTAFAVSEELENRRDEILKEFFGDGVTTEEAFNKLLAETEKMEGYENVPFQYVPDKDSYYVALGDTTAAVFKPNQKSSYVDVLAGELGVDFLNLAARRKDIQDVYSDIADNKAAIAKADLITMGWSNYGAVDTMFRFMLQYAALQKPTPVQESDWAELVGEENLPYVRELLDLLLQKIEENDLSDYEKEYALSDGLEMYAYTYISNALHLSQLIETIRQINADAAIVIVGTYNDFDGVIAEGTDRQLDLGELMSNMVNAFNLVSLRTADHYSRVAYVHAPDVDTNLKTSKPIGVAALVMGAARECLPNADGHAYIAAQIKAAMSDTCNHARSKSQMTAEATCGADGVITHTCTWCGHSWTEVIPATGDHKMGEWTKVDKTLEERKCKNCDYKETREVEPSEVVTGDANGDGRVNARDARALMRYISGMTDGSDIDMIAADMNGDGRVNARDARALLREVADQG